MHRTARPHSQHLLEYDATRIRGQMPGQQMRGATGAGFVQQENLPAVTAVGGQRQISTAPFLLPPANRYQRFQSVKVPYSKASTANVADGVSRDHLRKIPSPAAISTA
jgi:hypothetical protein